MPYSDYSSLYKKCDENCKKEWGTLLDEGSGAELAQIKNITDSITKNQTNTIDKITSIASFLYNRFKNQKGIPSAELVGLSPLQAFSKLSQNDSLRIWCGNFAQLFCYFSWSQGIVTRSLEILFPGNHHSLNECYDPDKQEWIMVDVTNNILLVQKNNKELDLPAFRKNSNNNLLLIRSTEDSIYAEPAQKSAIPEVYLSNAKVIYYHITDIKKMTSPGTKIRQYFLPYSPNYEIYDEQPHSNMAFYFKEVLILLWLVSFFVFLISLTKFNT